MRVKAKISDAETEYLAQKNVIEWCQWQMIPVFHIPNEGKRTTREGARLKAIGLSRGVPDLMIPVPSGGYHGLFIEMKTKTGRVTEAQAEWMKRLAENGYAVRLCRGSAQAFEAISDYIHERGETLWELVNK